MSILIVIRNSSVLCTSAAVLGFLSCSVAWGQVATDVQCDGCVQSGDIATNGVRRADIQNFAVNTPKLNNFAVSTAKIKPAAVTADKIAADAVGVTQIDPTQVQIRATGACGVGTFISSINEDGSVTCESGAFVFFNTRYGESALSSNTSGWYNTASGHNALLNNTSAFGNTAVGAFALLNTSTGGANTAIGDRALTDNTDGQGNTAVGGFAQRKNTTGQNNTAVGQQALMNNTTGWSNIALGWSAGQSLTSGDLNIYIGNSGDVTESNTIRIGTTSMQLRAFVAGVSGVTTGLNDAQAVVIDSNGQLGTINSSARYKDDIADMRHASARLLQLRPVSFRYKEPFENGERPIQYGLVAEEVAEVIPELVVYGEDGQPQTVKYHVLSSLLLNELQKQERHIRAQARRLSELEKLEGEVAELHELVSRMASLQAADAELLLADSSH